MKKSVKDELIELGIGTIFLGILAVIIMAVKYLENEYEVTRYLLTFNIIVLFCIPIYYFYYKNIEKHKTAKIEKNTIIKNIDFKYYRDIIDEYSPAMLSFILDGTEETKDLGSDIVYLINKGYLELQENNYIARTDKDCSNLSKDLQFLCNNDVNDLVKYKKLPKNDPERDKLFTKSMDMLKKWFHLVEYGSAEAGLVYERKKHRVTSLLIIACALEAVYTGCLGEEGLLCFSLVLTFVLLIAKGLSFDNNKWVKTQKGYELYTKVVGLKNYIADYSMLSEDELNQINIWDDYLIYAIIFNNTSKLNKEAMEFYQKII